MQVLEPQITKIKIDDTDVYLENFEYGKGKITLTNPYRGNYSMYWGAMGSNLEEFICNINSDYFADKLLNAMSLYDWDVKTTFTNIRKHIKSELLNWYEHLEFQKEMRAKLKEFEQYCEEHKSEQLFVDGFDRNFVNALDYYLIDDKYAREEVESNFKNITECWHFIENKESDTTKWLKSFHKKLVTYLNK